MRSEIVEDSRFEMALTNPSGRTLRLQIYRPDAADLLDREADECRRALTALGVELGAGT